MRPVVVQSSADFIWRRRVPSGCTPTATTSWAPIRWNAWDRAIFANSMPPSMVALCWRWKATTLTRHAKRCSRCSAPTRKTPGISTWPRISTSGRRKPATPSTALKRPRATHQSGTAAEPGQRLTAGWTARGSGDHSGTGIPLPIKRMATAGICWPRRKARSGNRDQEPAARAESMALVGQLEQAISLLSSASSQVKLGSLQQARYDARIDQLRDPAGPLPPLSKNVRRPHDRRGNNLP